MQKRKLKFKDKVIRIVKSIKVGETMSYKDVAFRAGNSGAARAVGMIMSKNQDLEVPCHRVIRSDGSLAGYNGLRGDKKQLLEQEKISCSNFC